MSPSQNYNTGNGLSLTPEAAAQLEKDNKTLLESNKTLTEISTQQAARILSMEAQAQGFAKSMGASLEIIASLSGETREDAVQAIARLTTALRKAEGTHE